MDLNNFPNYVFQIHKASFLNKDEDKTISVQCLAEEIIGLDLLC